MDLEIQLTVSSGRSRKEILLTIKTCYFLFPNSTSRVIQASSWKRENPLANVSETLDL